MNTETKNKILDRTINFIATLPKEWATGDIIEQLTQLKQCPLFDFSHVKKVDEKGVWQPLQDAEIKPETEKKQPQTITKPTPPANPVTPQTTPGYKCAVIIYHREVYQRYKKEWVDACIESIRNQSYKGFDVLELNYGDDNLQLYAGSVFFNEKKRNFIEAMNTLLDMAFEDYDVVFNTNLDDTYDTERFSLQLEEVKKGADLVSSDFRRIGDIEGDLIFHDKDIKAELNRTPPHNILCHPVICYTRKFWQTHGPYNPDSVKFEDMELWLKAINAGAKVHIVPKILCTQRIHNGNTGSIGEKH